MNPNFLNVHSLEARSERSDVGHHRLSNACIADAKPLCLPLEVWQQIARNFSTREWAQISGTCRVTREVQLHYVSITTEDHLNAAGLNFQEIKYQTQLCVDPTLLSQFNKMSTWAG